MAIFYLTKPLLTLLNWKIKRQKMKLSSTPQKKSQHVVMNTEPFLNPAPRIAKPHFIKFHEMAP